MSRRIRTRLFLVLRVWLVASLLVAGCSSSESQPPPTEEFQLLESSRFPGEPSESPEIRISPEPVVMVQATPMPENTPEATKKSAVEEAAAKLITQTSAGIDQVLAQFGEMSPQSADGPLAAAILLDAGVIQAAVTPRSFWLLNPMKDAQRMETYLPHEDFIWARTSIPARQEKFSGTPFQTGDLLYLIPADERLVGSYYAVTRLDSAGRVYTVTVLPGDVSGDYQIGEALLLDPASPEDGLLRNTSLALNGKGMLVWHKRSYADQTEYEQQLNRVLNRGGKWSVLVSDNGDETLFERDANAILHPASIIKVPLGLLLLRSLTMDNPDLDEALAKAPPQAGRTYGQLVHAMLALSEETATDILERDLVERMGEAWIRATLDGWGAQHTTLEPRRSTAHDIERLFRGLYTDEFLPKTAGRFMLVALGEVTAGDTVRLWKLNPVLPAGAVLYNKRGSLTNPMIVADAGILAMPDGSVYFICLVGNPDEWTTFEELDQTIGDFALAWYQIQIVEGLAP